jgi:hypothetical protein
LHDASFSLGTPAVYQRCRRAATRFDERSEASANGSVSALGGAGGRRRRATSPRPAHAASDERRAIPVSGALGGNRGISVLGAREGAWQDCRHATDPPRTAHIAEHDESGMMFSFNVAAADDDVPSS